ncbi:MAG: GNAT family N-acetyltransferase [Alphaproteobacteria bacterium]|nr:GNAT family N-acetyltransferase [Alphaproteobacteria bacterium]MCW5741223.1 GNAT family N-acetyltransferase [Alphaproteobacteria bacterium]
MSAAQAIAALFEPAPRGERRAVTVGELVVRAAAPNEGEWRNCFAIKRSGARLFGSGFRTGNLGRGFFRDQARRGHVLIVENAAGRRLGFVIVVREGEELELQNIYMRHEASGRGIGRLVMGGVLAFAARIDAPRVTLLTSGTAPWNRRWYESVGFRRWPLGVAMPRYLHKAHREEVARLGVQRSPHARARIVMVRPSRES